MNPIDKAIETLRKHGPLHASEVRDLSGLTRGQTNYYLFKNPKIFKRAGKNSCKWTLR